MRELLMAVIVIISLILTLKISEIFGIFLGIVFYCFVVYVAYALLLQPHENVISEIQKKYSFTSWNDLGLIGKFINIIFLSITLLLFSVVALAFLDLFLRAMFNFSLLETLGIIDSLTNVFSRRLVTDTVLEIRNCARGA